jgi:hypothetical protein
MTDFYACQCSTISTRSVRVRTETSWRAAPVLSSPLDWLPEMFGSSASRVFYDGVPNDERIDHTQATASTLVLNESPLQRAGCGYGAWRLFELSRTMKRVAGMSRPKSRQGKHWRSTSWTKVPTVKSSMPACLSICSTSFRV